jgi:hypothetical protein
MGQIDWHRRYHCEFWVMTKVNGYQLMKLTH